MDSYGAGTVSFDATTKRDGARAGRTTATLSAAAFAPISALYPTTARIVVSRVYVNFATLPTLTAPIFADEMDGTNVSGVYFNSSDSKLYCGKALLSLGASGVSVTTGVWYRLDLKLDTSANPWTIDAQVDGTALGQVTVAAAARDQTRLYMGINVLASPTFDMYWDTWKLSNTAVDYPLGAGNGWAGVPVSDGTHNVASAGDFDRTLTGTDITNATTTAWQLVDALPFIATDISAVECITITAPPNATDYVQCVFGPATSFSAAVNPPDIVTVTGALQTASAGGSPTMDLSLRINDGGTTGDVFTSSVFYQPTTPTFKTAQFATAPSGGAWTAAKLNALQVRFGSFDAADSAPDGYFGTCLIEADIPDTGTSVSVTAVAAAAPAEVPLPTVTSVGIVSVTAVPATSDAAVPSPSIAAQVAAVVAAIVAAADAEVPVPGVATVRNALITAVPAEAPAEVPLPTIVAFSVTSTTVTAVPAESPAEVPLPTIAAQVQTSVTGVAATAPAEVPVPAVAAVGIVSVTGVAATADAAVPLPTIAVQVQTSVTAVAATADAAVPLPTVAALAAGSASVTAVPAEAPAEVSLPAVTAIQITSITAVPAEASAEVPLPSVAAQVQTSVTAVPAESDAAASLPTVVAQQIAEILAVAAAASAEVGVPTVTTDETPTGPAPSTGVGSRRRPPVRVIRPELFVQRQPAVVYDLGLIALRLALRVDLALAVRRPLRQAVSVSIERLAVIHQLATLEMIMATGIEARTEIEFTEDEIIAEILLTIL